MLPAGSLGQEKGDDTRADFSMLAASGLSTARSRTSSLGLSRKTDTSGWDSSPLVNMIRTEIFDFFQHILFRSPGRSSRKGIC